MGEGKMGKAAVYGEPWDHNGNAAHVGIKCVFTVPREREERVEVASRIVACVNACAGIDDPAEFLAEVERLVEAAKPYADLSGTLRAALSALEAKR